MAARFLASSVNVVVHDSDNTNSQNTQNARIHFDTVDTSGWTVATNGTLSGGTELRRAVLDSADKSAPGSAQNTDVGVEFTYISAQKRSVKVANGNDTDARVVFAPAHL